MKPLLPSELSAPCDPAALPFASTAELEPRDEIVGQAQALRALDLGLSVRAEGYNLFVVGEPQTGKHSILRRLIGARAKAEPVPPDLCYVHNFDDPDRPLVLELPAGRSRPIRVELERLVTDYARRLPLAFDGEAFGQRAAVIAERMARERDRLLAEIEARLGASGFKLETSGGALDVSPVAPEGGAMTEEAFAALPPAKRAEIDERGRALRTELEPSAIRRLGVDALLMEREFNRAVGFTPEDDGLPAFFYEEPLARTNRVARFSGNDVNQSLNELFAAEQTAGN